MNQQWTLGGLMLVAALLAASDAHASRSYVPSEQPLCSGTALYGCGKAVVSGNQVGTFELDGVVGDKAPVQTCAMGAGSCGTHSLNCPVVQTVSGIGEIAAGPVRLAGAVVNDAYLLLTMPYRPSEPLN